MGKKKSIVFITLITILLAALIFFSFVPFPINAVSKFNSFVGSSKLGMELAGGVETVLYPDGVISKADHQSMQAEYQEKYDKWVADGSNPDTKPVNEADEYVGYKGVFIQKKNIDSATGQVSNDFQSRFEKAFGIIQRRFEQKLYTNYSIFKQDDYTILVRVPKTKESSSSLFSMMSASGGLHFSGEANTKGDLYLNNNDAKLIRNASVVDSGNRYGVRINFTSAGRAKIKELTQGAGQSNNNNGVTNVGGDNSNKQSKTIYLYLGKTQLLQASTEQELDTSSLVFPVSETREAADTVAALINLSRKQENLFNMAFTIAPTQTFVATMGTYTALILLLTLAGATVAGILYMFIRYKGLGFVYMLSMLTFILAIILCTTFIPVLVITPSSFIAILFIQLLMTIFTKKAFDRIKVEFKKGKTLAKAIRDAFNSTIFLTAEVHGALFVFSVLCYAIATGMMQSVSLLCMLGVALSAAITLGLNRFYLYLTMPQAKNKIAYCNLRKEVVDLDDEDE